MRFPNRKARRGFASFKFYRAVLNISNILTNTPDLPWRALILIPGGVPKAYWYDLGIWPPDQIAVGQLVQVPLQTRTVSGLVLEIARPRLDFETKSIIGFAPRAEQVPKAYLEMLQWMAEYYLTPLPVVLATCLPKSALRYLFHLPKRKAKGKSASKPPEPASVPAAPKLMPNDAQAFAIEAVAESMEAKAFSAFLLHGVTGSGKTLVYLHLVRQVLALGRRALLLVPEIALTPQTVARFEDFLGRKVAVYHSNLGEAERRGLWQGLFSGSIDLVIGPRSAALLPIDNLGLIVVDEEHDASFKQDSMAPRYHARDVALWRGRQASCPVLLGSATPALESFHAAKSGKYRLLTLTERATGASAPHVTVVDMRKQWELQGNQVLSIPLRDALQSALARGEQAILFLNRRGYSPRRVCQACGQPRPCQRCAVPLVYHKRRHQLICHHCGFTADPEGPCPLCRHIGFVDAGRGLEQVEENLRGLFPKVALERLDRDSSQAIGATEAVLDRFRRGEMQLLLGTQMVAKGHDFPRVSLVGVLDADAGLGLADFRAQERAFQLITQVSGRAGRHQVGGQVFLQTTNPDNPLLTFALSHDYQGFYQSEIVRRQELGYPPFLRLLLIELYATEEKDLIAAMRIYGEALQTLAERAEVVILGPVPAAIRRLQGDWRGHILLKGASAKRLQWLIAEARQIADKQIPKKVKLRLDMDPQNLL